MATVAAAVTRPACAVAAAERRDDVQREQHGAGEHRDADEQTQCQRVARVTDRQHVTVLPHIHPVSLSPPADTGHAGFTVPPGEGAARDPSDTAGRHTDSCGLRRPRRRVGVMAKTPGRNDLPAAPNPASPQDIRNVVLVGPGGAGKTALFDALLASRVAGQRAAPTEHVRTTGLTVASFDTGAVTLNLLDTPGYPDFVGDLRAGSPRRRCGGLRRVGGRRHRPSGLAAVARVLRRRHAAGRRGHPPRPASRRLRDHRRDLPAHLRRCPGDALAGRGGRHGHRRDRPAHRRDHRRARRRPQRRSSSRSSRSRRTRPCSTATSKARRSTPTRSSATCAPPSRRAPSSRSCPSRPLTGVGVEELLGIIERAFPDPTVHPLPAITTPVGGAAQRGDLRPVAAARRRGGAHDDRPLRRAPLARAGLRGHASRRRDRARLRAPRRLRRARGRRPPRARRRRARRAARVALRRQPPAARHGDRR